MPVEPSAINVPDVVGLVWTTTLDLPLEALDDAGQPVSWSEPIVEALVHISGDWRGAVALHAPASLVELIAQRMFQLDDHAPTPDDMRDAFGELANIIGGNIKGLVSDGGASLSLPTVGERGEEVAIPGNHQIVRCTFTCDGRPLVVSVLQGTMTA